MIRTETTERKMIGDKAKKYNKRNKIKMKER